MFFHSPLLIESNGYITPTKDNTALKTLAHFAKYLTYISILGYSIYQDGSLSPLSDTSLIQAAHQNNVKPLMVITNFDDGVFSSHIAHKILSNASTRQLLIDNILRIATSKKYAGIHIDFEGVLAKDMSFLYRFIVSLKKHLQKRDLTLSMIFTPTDITLLTPTPHAFAARQHHTYLHQAIEALDFVVVMCDTCGWSRSPPAPISSFNRLKVLLDYLRFWIPAHKTMLSLPLYGYDWLIPFSSNNKCATCLSLAAIDKRISQESIVVHTDYLSQSPYFNYFDNEGNNHIVWFENEQSLFAKCTILRKLRLRGVGLWSLSLPLSLQTPLFEKLFKAKK